jgi:hypothetical protein
MCAYGDDSGATLPLASAFPQGASGAASGLAIAARRGLARLAPASHSLSTAPGRAALAAQDCSKVAGLLPAGWKVIP